MAKFRIRGRFVSERKWKSERKKVERKINKFGQSMKRAIRLRDKARSKKTKQKWQRVIDRARPKQQKELRQRQVLEKQGTAIPKGRRVEVTIRFTYATRPSGKKQQLRWLKVVVEVQRKNVTRAQIERAVEDAMRSGHKTRGLKLLVADWDGTRGSGRLRGSSVAAQLAPFGALLAAGKDRTRSVRNVGRKRSR